MPKRWGHRISQTEKLKRRSKSSKLNSDVKSAHLLRLRQFWCCGEKPKRSGGKRGRLISSSDRIIAIELIEQAHVSGARYFVAPKVIGISDRTLERWKNRGDNVSDCRIGSIHPTPPNALSEQERQGVLEVCHKEEFSSLPPAQVVPILADRGIYLASESTFYRILAANGENKHRSRSKPPQKREVTKHEVSGPNQVWVTDISWLRGPVKGLFYYLYFVMDLYSRKIVGFEV